jgi:hypothetical protein
VATFAALRNDFPGSIVVALGDVSPISPSAGHCGEAPLLNADLSFLGEEVVGSLNQAIADAADAAGVAFVNPADVTIGHELCTNDSWFRGLSSPIQQSFHPTQVAHDQIAAWFAAHYTDGAGHLVLSDPPPATDPIRPSPSGTPGSIVPIHASAPPGGCLQGCAIHIQGSGYAPGSVGSIVLHSDPVDLGLFTADQDGAVDVAVQIPTDTPVGPHIITMDGVAPDGAPQWASDGVDVISPPTPPVDEGQQGSGSSSGSGVVQEHEDQTLEPAIRARLTVRRKKARVRIVVGCPASASSVCKVDLSLRRRWRVRGHRRSSTIARKRVIVSRGGQRTVTIVSRHVLRHPRQLTLTARTSTSTGVATTSLALRRCERAACRA